VVGARPRTTGSRRSRGLVPPSDGDYDALKDLYDTGRVNIEESNYTVGALGPQAEAYARRRRRREELAQRASRSGPGLPAAGRRCRPAAKRHRQTPHPQPSAPVTVAMGMPVWEEDALNDMREELDRCAASAQIVDCRPLNE